MIVWQQTCTRMRPQGTRSGWYLFSEYLYREDRSIFLLENRDFQAFLWWGMSCNNNHHHFTGRPTWRLLANLSGVFLNNSIKNSLLEIQSLHWALLGRFIDWISLNGNPFSKRPLVNIHYSFYFLKFILLFCAKAADAIYKQPKSRQANEPLRFIFMYVLIGMVVEGMCFYFPNSEYIEKLAVTEKLGWRWLIFN